MLCLHCNRNPPQSKAICEQCFRDAHPCTACGRDADASASSKSDAGLVKCGQANCGRWYHVECAAAHPFTKPIYGAAGADAAGSGGGRGRGRGRGRSAGAATGGAVASAGAAAAGGAVGGGLGKFRCPLHTCAVCTGSGEGAVIMACVRCATAYHAKCKPDEAELVAKKLLLCPSCVAARDKTKAPKLC